MHQSPESSGVLSLNASGSEGAVDRDRNGIRADENQRRSLTNQCWLPVNG